MNDSEIVLRLGTHSFILRGWRSQFRSSHQMNRPYGPVVSADLKDAVPETATQKIFLGLVEKGELVIKTCSASTSNHLESPHSKEGQRRGSSPQVYTHVSIDVCHSGVVVSVSYLPCTIASRFDVEYREEGEEK